MENISKETKETMGNAMLIAESVNDIYLRPEHITLAIIQNNDPFILDILTSLGIDMDELESDLLEKVNENLTPRVNNSKDFTLDPLPLTKAVMTQANHETREAGDGEVSNIHVLLSLVSVDTKTKAIINSFGVEYSDIINTISPKSEANNSIFDEDEEEDIFTEPIINSEGKSKTPVLDSFAVDLTELAKSGVLDPMVGRQVELRRIFQILIRKKKNNPVLIGEPGVGKCICSDSLVTVREKTTGKLFTIDINKFKTKFLP